MTDSMYYDYDYFGGIALHYQAAPHKPHDLPQSAPLLTACRARFTRGGVGLAVGGWKREAIAELKGETVTPQR